MDIKTYLRHTTELYESANESNEQPLLGWLTESLGEFNLGTPIEVVSVATRDSSHKYLRLTGKNYVVWDATLNGTLWKLLQSVQYKRLAYGAESASDAEQFDAIATTLWRHTMFTYLARKLADFPHVAWAFFHLAASEPAANYEFEMPETELMSEIFDMQRILMFYHESNHAVLAERPDLREESTTKLHQLLKDVQPFVSEQKLSEDMDVDFPEFRALNNDERSSHFAEELNCDFQSFVFASMALPNAPGLPRRAWQDSIGILFGASAMLSISERVLKLAAAKWLNFARESSDGVELTNSSLELTDFSSERPLYFIRKWNTILALQSALKRLGAALSIDAFEWEEYVINKMNGLGQAVEEHLVTQLNATATPEFIAKVFARAQYVQQQGSPQH